jgi:aminocarboxymuconate-semialdehyde decarboxylase
MTDTGPIDVHAHHVDPDALTRMEREAPGRMARLQQRPDGGWAMELPPGFFGIFPDGATRPIPTGVIDLEVRRADMDRQGVGAHVLGPYTFLTLYDQPGDLAATLYSIHNDAVIATARDEPDRFIALPGLPVQAPELAAAEVRRLAAISEVAGVGIGTNIAGMDLDDERIEPMWAALDEVGLPILLHPPGLVIGGPRVKPYHLSNLIGNPTDSTVAIARIILSGVLERYANLRFVLVHGGGFMPYQLGRWDHAWRLRDDVKARTPRPPSEYLPGRIFFDTLTHDPQALAFLGERVGWEHVMLGSDYPWDMSTVDPVGDVRRAGIEGDRFEAVTVGNARRFLRLPSAG